IELSQNAANTLVTSESNMESAEDIAPIVEIVMAKMDQNSKTESADTEADSHTLASNEAEQSSEDRLTKLLLDTEEALSSSSPNDNLALSEQTAKIRAASDAAVVAYKQVVTKHKTRSQEHQIEQGDTLFSIARSHDTTVSKIVSYNHMKKEAALKIGTILKIPPKGYMPERSNSRSLASVSKVKAAEKKKLKVAKKVKTVKAKKIASAPNKVLKKRHAIAKHDTYKVKKVIHFI
ncbi:MAG TPA: LysM domain-containing protein, partial [Epsilonproteobacteria bacterium]|nr:LysM domain-containing protein [Campylobacterota bacterium]